MNAQREPESAEPPAPRFQFSLRHYLASPFVLAACVAAFGLGGQFACWTVILLAFLVLGDCIVKTFSKRLILVAGLWIIPTLLPLMRAGRGPHPMGYCMNNLHCLTVALHNYHDQYGSFPPAYIADEDGRPMHSWRVLILPYMERNDLYQAYDFNEPWDGPNNRKLAGINVREFSCPSDTGRLPTMTSYVAVVGPNTVWPGTQTTRLRSLSDGPSHTILLVEVVNSGIHWMEPRDLHVLQMAPTINPTAGHGISSTHEGIVMVSYADGRQVPIPETISPEELRAMLTRSGGEPIE